MCLAIPSKVVSVGPDLQGVVDVMGIERSASFDLTPQVQPGQYVLLHAGFAIEVVDEQYARESIELIEDMEDMVGEELAEAQGPDAAHPQTLEEEVTSVGGWGLGGFAASMAATTGTAPLTSSNDGASGTASAKDGE